MEIINYFFVALFGVAIGSFLAAYTYRLPKNISIAAGRSFCDKCRKKIAWHDNIPVLSFLILHGRCRNCDRKIALRYPLIETATAVSFTVSFFIWKTTPFYFSESAIGHFSQSLGVLFPVFIFFVLAATLAIFVVDFEHQIIPDQLVFGLIFVTLGVILIFNSEILYLHLFTGFAASCALLLLHLVTFGRGMGLGDVKFALAAGLLLGWPGILVWLFVAFLTGACVGVILLVTGRARIGKRIAFGPFLAASLVLTLFVGNYLYEFFY